MFPAEAAAAMRVARTIMCPLKLVLIFYDVGPMERQRMGSRA